MSAVDVSDPPFKLPIERTWVVLDICAPPSVNRIRRYDFASSRVVKSWYKGAEGFVYAAMCRRIDPLRIRRLPLFELHITFSEAHTGIDLDNGLKVLIDFLKHAGLIEDDSRKHMRRLVVEWGEAPAGARVRLRPWVAA